jgi:hypothetical protein
MRGARIRLVRGRISRLDAPECGPDAARISLGRPAQRANHLHRFARFTPKPVNGDACAGSFAKIFCTADRVPSASRKQAVATLVGGFAKLEHMIARCRLTLQKPAWNRDFSHCWSRMQNAARALARERAKLFVPVRKTTTGGVIGSAYTLR